MDADDKIENLTRFSIIYHEGVGDYMVDRAKLEKCRRLRREAEYAKERLQEITPKITARTDLLSRGSGKGQGQPTEAAALAMISIEDMLSFILKDYESLVKEISEACMKIDPVYRELIMLRYIEGCSWSDIALKMMYSESYLYELNRKAIQEIAKASGG